MGEGLGSIGASGGWPRRKPTADDLFAGFEDSLGPSLAASTTVCPEAAWIRLQVGVDEVGGRRRGRGRGEEAAGRGMGCVRRAVDLGS